MRSPRPFQKASSRGPARSARPACFEDLPAELLLRILLHLPLRDRVRCGAVNKRLEAALSDPSCWSEISFEGADARRVDAEAILDACRRSKGGQLRSLDISFPAPKQRRPYSVGLRAGGGRNLFRTLAAEGLASHLVSLSLGKRLREENTTGSGLCELAHDIAAGCPALKSIEADFSCERTWRETAEALRVLGPKVSSRSTASFKMEFVHDTGPHPFAAPFARFATGVAAALRSCPGLRRVRLRRVEWALADAPRGPGARTDPSSSSPQIGTPATSSHLRLSSCSAKLSGGTPASAGWCSTIQTG